MEGLLFEANGVLMEEGLFSFFSSVCSSFGQRG